MILLDTCTLLWLALDQSGLSPAARESIGKNAGRLAVSPISAFEIGQKAARGKLSLRLAPEHWFPRAVELHGLAETRLDAAILLRATTLPDLHRDPFDRILVATAQSLGCTLLTPDPQIRQYPEVGTLW